MKKISLCGEWSYTVGGSTSTVSVPFSHLPVGRSFCEKSFDFSNDAEKVFLKFDGITYWARVTLNGKVLGEMLPYCEYSFDVTDHILPQNKLTVELEDIDRSFGPTEGWENFGGIIRGVSLILLPDSYIKDVFFKSKLTDNFSRAEISVEVECENGGDGELEISLFDGEQRVLCYTQKDKETFCAELKKIKLWSPDSPELYRLEVALKKHGEVIDRYLHEVGLRDIAVDRHRFLLNGQPIFLGGVCKHEMVGDSGHCPTDAQIEADLRQIKSMGCNFVRLVHYPHSKKTLEIADRIGLLVSEEPGLWWSDTSDPAVAKGSLEVLKRTVLRDRNHPSVAFWLCFNECRFTEKFLLDSVNVCRKYDPTRLVSGANCMSNEETLVYYNKCGFDFYTMHPYAPTFERARESAKILCDKPLIFTEWGGYYLYDNPHLLTDFMSEMNALYLQGSDDGALAGAFFWFFAELNDFNRGEPACTDGVLHEGLVDGERRPTLIYETFCKNMKLFGKKPAKKPFWCEIREGFEDLSNFRKLEFISGGEDFLEHFENVRVAEKQKNCMRQRKLEYAPIFKECTPKLVGGDKLVVFSGSENFSKLVLIGLTTLEGGYPLGKYGEEIAELTLNYADGTKKVVELKNGVHVTTAFTLNGSSRIDPKAERAIAFANFGYDKNFECYIVNRLDVPIKDKKHIASVSVEAKKGKTLLIYGAFAQ